MLSNHLIVCHPPLWPSIFPSIFSIHKRALEERKGTTEDEMVGWHHQLGGHEFEQTPGAGDGQGSLACYGPWGCKELDRNERLT